MVIRQTESEVHLIMYFFANSKMLGCYVYILVMMIYLRLKPLILQSNHGHAKTIMVIEQLESELHLSLCFLASFKMLPCYVYIHEDELFEALVHAIS